jgi:hypothetical protein
VDIVVRNAEYDVGAMLPSADRKRSTAGTGDELRRCARLTRPKRDEHAGHFIRRLEVTFEVGRAYAQKFVRRKLGSLRPMCNVL